MPRFPLLTLALALPLAACGDGTDDPAAEEPAEVEAAETTPDVEAPGRPPFEAPRRATAQGTLDAVEDAGGLTRLAVAAATRNIDGWIAQLDGQPEFTDFVDDLRTLRDLLQASPIDGAAVGAVLRRLGPVTSRAGVDSDDESLEALGRVLTEAGERLAPNV